MIVSYLNWVINYTRTKWWHDSAEEAELDLGLERGAVGVTTNPFLSAAALKTDRALWAVEIDDVRASPDQRAHVTIRADLNKASIPNCDRLTDRKISIDGDDLAVA